MDTKLIDFSADELQTLLDIVVAKIVDEDEHKREWIKRFGQKPYKLAADEADVYYDSIQRPLRNVNYEHLCLWRTQIKTAIGKVTIQDEINSN